jgi:hypothetical protein
MSFRYKVKPEKDMLLKLEEFFVYSWNVHEFLDAVESPDFFNNVKHVLDTDLSSDASASPGDLVLSKLYFAGVSARRMFLFPTRHDGNDFDRPFLKELIELVLSFNKAILSLSLKIIIRNSTGKSNQVAICILDIF